MISTLIRPAIGVAALLATIPLIAVLHRSLEMLFGFEENGWITLATFALAAVAYTAAQWKLTQFAAPLFRQAAKFLKFLK